MKAALLIVLSIVSSFSHASAEAYPKPQSPTELHELFSKYFADRDMEGLGTLFHQDAVLVLDAEGNQAKGRQAILVALDAYMQSDVNIVMNNVSIHLNGNLALIRATWEIPGVQKGMSIEVMQYVDGGWVYIIDNPNGF